MGLPGLSGYQVAEHLRAFRETKHAVLVGLTGYGQPEDQRRALDAGFNYHLVKPVDLDKLEQLIYSVERQETLAESIGNTDVA